MNTDRKHIRLYTDGACSGNPGPGGWCAVLLWGGHQRVLQGGQAETTSNRMELTAIIEGLSAIKEPCRVTVFTDSQYAIAMMTLGWKRKANLDLLFDLDALCAAHDVTFEHVRGHNGYPLNEKADRLARMERDKARVRAANSGRDRRVFRDGFAPGGFPCCDCYETLDIVRRPHRLPSDYEQLPDVIADMAP